MEELLKGKQLYRPTDTPQRKIRRKVSLEQQRFASKKASEVKTAVTPVKRSKLARLSR